MCVCVCVCAYAPSGLEEEDINAIAQRINEVTSGAVDYIAKQKGKQVIEPWELLRVQWLTNIKDTGTSRLNFVGKFICSFDYATHAYDQFLVISVSLTGTPTFSCLALTEGLFQAGKNEKAAKEKTPQVRDGGRGGHTKHRFILYML